MRFFRQSFLPLLMAATALYFSSCSNQKIEDIAVFKTVKEYDSKVVQDWQDMFLVVERYAAVYRPCPAARMSGYVGLAVYEATVSGMPEYQSIAPRYGGLNIPKVETGKEYHWPTVINSVYATLYKRFFANVKAEDLLKIASLESSNNIRFASEISGEVFRRSKELGINVANSVWDYSATDREGHDKYLDPRPSSYVPPAGLGKWKQANGPAAMFPYWGKVRTC